MALRCGEILVCIERLAVPYGNDHLSSLNIDHAKINCMEKILMVSATDDTAIRLGVSFPITREARFYSPDLDPSALLSGQQGNIQPG